jgi:hypothetical protein
VQHPAKKRNEVFLAVLGALALLDLQKLGSEGTPLSQKDSLKKRSWRNPLMASKSLLPRQSRPI